MMKIVQYMFLLLTISNFIQAQEMVTDRPDATESAQIVPLLHLQIESGFTTDRKSNVWDEKTFETLVRFGLHRDIELRLGFEYSNFDLFVASPVKTSTLFPSVKYKLYQGKGLIPTLAVMGTAEVSASGGSTFWSPELRLAAQHDILELIELSYNVAFFWSDKNYHTNTFYSVALGVDLTNKLGIYAELFGNNYKTLANDGYVNGGFSYSLLNNLCVDAFYGMGINSASSDHFFGAGFSFRLPR